MEYKPVALNSRYTTRYKFKWTQKSVYRDFPGSLVVKSVLPIQGSRVPSLVGEQRFLHASPCGQKKCLYSLITHECRASLVALVVKNAPANAGVSGDTGLIPGWRGYPGGGDDNPPQHLCLENPMDRGAWQATIHEVTKSWTRLTA